MIEVCVTGIEHEPMLEDEGRDPPIVGGHRRPLVPELAVHRGVVVRGLLVREEHGHPGAKQKAPEAAFIA